jgi:hypothetical protein
VVLRAKRVKESGLGSWVADSVALDVLVSLVRVKRQSVRFRF